MEVLTILGVNHLGIAAKDPEKFKWFFGQVLGLSFTGSELVVDQKTLTGMFRSSQVAVTLEPRLELLEPVVGGEGDGPIAKYLEKKGGGIHHLAFTVNSVEAAIAHATQQGVRMIDMTARSGAHRTRIAFVHPESTGGVLVEFVEQT